MFLVIILFTLTSSFLFELYLELLETIIERMLINIVENN